MLRFGVGDTADGPRNGLGVMGYGLGRLGEGAGPAAAGTAVAPRDIRVQ